MAAGAILDVRNSLSIAFLAILDRYANLFIFDKMAAVGHFGCPKFTLDHIFGHFRSIQIFILFFYFLQNGYRRPFWMSEIHFRSHFWPFLIDTQLEFCWKFLTKWLPSAKKHFGWHFWPFQINRPFWMSEIHFRWHFWPFQIHTELFFWIFLTKWPPAAILDGTTMSIIKLVRHIWMSNACVKFEERSLNPSKCIARHDNEIVTWRRTGLGCCVADENIIFLKTYVFREIII